MVAIGNATKDAKYWGAADVVLAFLTADFDPKHGVFNSKNVYNTHDVAWIIGSLNFMLQRGNYWSKNSASDTRLAFYESTISLDGMQLSAPSGKNGVMASEFEKDLPSLVCYHPTNSSPPPMVGELPVAAEEITWDGSSWSVTKLSLVTAGAIHLADVLNWLGSHQWSIPFPPLGAGTP